VEVDVPKQLANVIWCPSFDTEMTGLMKNFISSYPNMHPTAMEGGAGGLDAFESTGTLFILAHGNEQIPVFMSNKRSFTAPKLAEMLELDGLAKDWREIELLVCHAGESVNSAKVGNQLLDLRGKSLQAQEQGDMKNANKFRQAFGNVAKKSQPPTPFTRKDQLLPLAALFTQALKERGYTNFRLTSYAAPVAQYFHSKDRYLRLPKSSGEGTEFVLASTRPDLVKIWR
jgi:hypothetical protein